MQKEKRIGLDLTEGPVLPLLMRFVFPLLMSNIVQQLYNTVDVMVIGQFSGTAGTVGVSTGGEVAALLTFIATSFGAAAQIYTAQLCGAKDQKGINESIGTTLLSMLIFSAACAVICVIGTPVFLRWLNCPDEAWKPSSSYMLIVSLGLPFVFGYNAVCGILRGMGEAKKTFFCIAIAAISNIVMDLLLVIVFHLEAAGTAIATVLAQMASFISIMIYLFRHRKQFALEFSARSMKIQKKHLLVLIRLGIPLTAQSALVHFTQLICASSVNTFGMSASAANSIGNKLHKLINVFLMSVNSGAGAMIGQNLGAGKTERVREIVRKMILCCAAISFVSSLIVLLIPRQMLSFFTKDEDVIELAVIYMHIMLLVYVIAPFQGTFHAVVTGSGEVHLSLLGGLLDGVVLRLGISYLFAYPLHMGVIGFFYGNALGRLGPLIVCMPYYFSGKWKNKKLLSEEHYKEKERIS